MLEYIQIPTQSSIPELKDYSKEDRPVGSFIFTYSGDTARPPHKAPVKSARENKP